jgi:hypothetical protein
MTITIGVEGDSLMTTAVMYMTGGGKADMGKNVQHAELSHRVSLCKRIGAFRILPSFAFVDSFSHVLTPKTKRYRVVIPRVHPRFTYVGRFY